MLLLTEANWVHRRVETIDFLSTELARRSTSVDLTVPEPFRAMLRIDDGQFVVPIATLAKRPLRNFDLRDEAGRAIPVLGRDHNGDIAHGALIGLAELALEEAGLGSLTPQTVAHLRAIACGTREEADQTAGALIRAAEEGDAELAAVLEDDWTFYLISLLASSYILLAVVREADTRRILKFAYDEGYDDSRSRLQRVRQGLGIAALTFQINAPAAVRAASYHAEIVIPEQLRIEEAFLYDVEDLSIYGDADIDADRGALYASSLELSARPALFVRLDAERAGLPTVAFAVSVVTASMLILGAVVFKPDATTGGPSVSVLLAASALFAGAVAQRGEHDLVQRFFTHRRAVLVLTGVTALVAASTLAFNASPHTIDVVWKTCAAAATVFASILGYAYRRAVPMSRASSEEET